MKKLIFNGLFLTTIGISIISCKKDKLLPINNNSSTPTESQIPVKSESVTILGDKLENPYTVENMQLAFNQLTSDKNQNETLEKTDLYVRFLPKNSSELKILVEDLELDLWDTPVEYEVKEYGAYYHDPSLPSDNYTWQYTTVKPDFQFPNIKYEIIDELFLPENSKQSNISNLVNIEELEFTALKITNNLEKGEVFGTKAQKWNPQGYIRVENYINQQTISGPIAINNIVPVKNVKVRAQRWFHIASAWTNDNGYFFIDSKYRKNCEIKVIFKNNNVKIRAIRGFNVQQMSHVVRKLIGEFDYSDIANVDYTFFNTPDLETEEKAQWVACQTINSMREFENYSNEDGLPAPLENMNVWLTTKITSDAASPMIHKIGTTPLMFTIVELYLISSGNPLFAAVYPILLDFSPDITFDYDRKYDALTSDLIANTLYHEFTHSTHYKKVGNSYWLPYIGYIVSNLGYGDGTASGAGRIEVSETWAETIGDIYTDRRYTITSIGTAYTKNMEKYPYYDWMAQGIMYDMVDNDNYWDTYYGYVDNVNQYTLINCYNAMDNDVLSLVDFKNRILLETNNLQQTEVNDLFTSYGF